MRSYTFKMVPVTMLYVYLWTSVFASEKLGGSGKLLTPHPFGGGGSRGSNCKLKSTIKVKVFKGTIKVLIGVKIDEIFFIICLEKQDFQKVPRNN